MRRRDAASTTDDDAEQYDGVLVFDEAHRAKNLAPSEARGRSSKTADAVLEIQRRLAAMAAERKELELTQ